MAERPIADLLGSMPEPARPDPAFEARLRSLLAAELADRANLDDRDERDRPSDAHRARTTQEVFEVELIADATPISHLRFARIGVAAGVLAIAATAAIVTVVDDDRESATVHGLDRTFVGGSIATTAIEGGTNPYFVAVGEDAWVLSLGGDLVQIDGETGDVVGRTTVPESSPLAVDDQAVWIADAVSGDVLRLDTDTREIVERIPTGVEVLPSAIRVPMLEGESRQFSLIGGIASDGDAVWVGDRAGRVLRIDPGANEIVESFDVRVRPDLLQVEGDHLLVADPYGGEAAVIDTSDGSEVVAAPAADELAGAALFGGALYVQDAGTGVVTRIDLGSGDAVTSGALGASLQALSQPTLPTGLRVGGAGVLVDTAGEPSLHVLDPITLRELGTLAVQADQGDMAIGPDGSAWLVRSQARDVLHIEPRAR